MRVTANDVIVPGSIAAPSPLTKSAGCVKLFVIETWSPCLITDFIFIKSESKSEWNRNFVILITG